MENKLIMPIAAPLRLAAGEIRFYQDEGYLYIPGLLAAETLDQLRQEVLEVLAAAGMSRERLRRAQSAKDKLIQSGQYLAESALDAFINSPHLLDLGAQLMGGPSSLYMPFTAAKSSGGGTFHFHQDNQYTRFDGPGLNMWFALSPMTPENGCLQIVPRSHGSGTLDAVENPDGDGHRTVAQDTSRFWPVRMNAGDCIVFSRLTLHGSGPNQTAEPRLAYAIQYHRNDVRAVWDGQPPRLLLGAARWNTTPVAQLSQPAAKARDGH